MAKWFHECGYDWLRGRQKFLTATDIKDLLPVTKTGRKRNIDDEDYIKVLARKLVNLMPADCISVGAAARGHILEPYAIDCFNESGYAQIKMYHWDDMIVTRPINPFLSLSFSPDAMSVSMDSPMLLKDSVVQGIGFPVKAIAEVKSYSPEKHLTCGYADKMSLEERWQVATAMAVLDSIETAYLLFYNPSMTKKLFVVEYSRDDLEDEIKTILEVEDKWIAWYDNVWATIDDSAIVFGGRDESSIVNEIMKKEEFNPENKKSVVM